MWIPGRLDIAPYRDALKDYISLIFQTVEDFFFKRAGAATRLTTRGRWSNDWLLHQARLRLRLVDNNNVSGAVGRHGEGGFRLIADVQWGQSDDRSAPKPDALKVEIKTSPALVRPASPPGAEPLRFPCGQG